MTGVAEILLPKLEVVAERFCGQADFTKNLGELAEGNFSIVDPAIFRAGNFPCYHRGSELSKALALVRFDRPATLDEVEESLDRKMFRPAELIELAALGVCFPEEPLRGPILTPLVSRLEEERKVPGLSWTKEQGKGIWAYRCEKFSAICRFAAVALEPLPKKR